VFFGGHGAARRAMSSVIPVKQANQRSPTRASTM